MKKSILKANKDYTFRDYFEMNYPLEEIVGEFGYTTSLEKLSLPQIDFAANAAKRLEEAFYQNLPQITLNSEMARREFLIAPLLFELLTYVKAKINVEYPLEVSQQLKGSLDYLIRSGQNLIVIEAKKGDLEKGFNQLAVELIALDQYLEDEQPMLYGAITIGDVWRFGVLERAAKLIKKDFRTYNIPMELQTLFSILGGILNPST